MTKFDDFVETILAGAKNIAKDIIKDFEDAAVDDTKAFLNKSEKDLKRWTKLLALEVITEQDFSDLIQARSAVAELHSLRQQGVVLTTLQQFRTKLISLIIDTAFEVFL